MRIAIIFSAAVVSLAVIANDASAQGYYRRTAQRNPVTGRQQIVDLHAPRWMGSGQGGYMFDAGSGSLQVTSVNRNRATGRLEYFNQYLNPWTGARYSTSTQFNPYTNRYQTQHNFAPPAARDDVARTGDSPLVIESLPPTKRRPRIIETKSAVEDVPTEIEPPVAPAAESSASDNPAPAGEPAVTIEIRTP